MGCTHNQNCACELLATTDPNNMEHARVLVGSEQIFKGPQHAHALINTRLGRLQCHFVARDKGLSRAFAARAKRDNAPSALPYVAQYRCANTGASSLGDSIQSKNPQPAFCGLELMPIITQCC